MGQIWGYIIWVLLLGCAKTSFSTEVPEQARDDKKWSIEPLIGTAYNVPMPPSFEQGEYASSTTAHYSTRPFAKTSAPYYDFRIAYRFHQDYGASFEHLHHKLYLDNPPTGVQVFQMTYGYNFLFTNLAKYMNKWLALYGGLGPILVHSISTVNRKVYPNEDKFLFLPHQYDLVGFGAQVGAAYRYPVLDFMSLLVDTKLTTSYSQVPIVDGSAKVYQLSLHINAGLAFVF